MYIGQGYVHIRYTTGGMPMCLNLIKQLPLVIEYGNRPLLSGLELGCDCEKAASTLLQHYSSNRITRSNSRHFPKEPGVQIWVGVPGVVVLGIHPQQAAVRVPEYPQRLSNNTVNCRCDWTFYCSQRANTQGSRCSVQILRGSENHAIKMGGREVKI